MKVIKWILATDDVVDSTIDQISSNEMRQCVIDCIIEHTYRFDGSYHQYGSLGCPVILCDDGTEFIYFCIMREWGAIMSDAWNQIESTDKYTYMDFYHYTDTSKDKYPYDTLSH